MAKPRKRYTWLTGLYALIATSIYWGHLILNSHEYLFSSKTSGVKEYFSTLYYALYDQNSLFTGVEYPYGEHLAFANAQPALSYPLSWLINGNFQYAGNIITILNLLMIFSIPVAAMYLYRIFASWKMPSLYSSAFAVAIAILSPQVLRFTDFHAFAYVCFFPMIWYYITQWLQNRKVSSIISLTVVLTFFTFLHFTYALIAITFIGITVISHVIYKLQTKKYQSKAGFLILASLFPIALYAYWMKGHWPVDLVFPHYNDLTISWKDVFIPANGFARDIINIFYPVADMHDSSYSYVGSAAILSIMAGIWVLRDRVLEKELLAPSIGVYLFSASMCLLIALGLPFSTITTQWLPFSLLNIDSLSVFTIPFYFVFASTGVWLLYILSEFIKKKGQSFIASSIVVLVFSLWLYEGMLLQKKQTIYIQENGKLVEDFLSFKDSYQSFLTDIGQSSDFYQGILAFPYFEKEGTNLQQEAFYQAAKASLETQIPIAQNTGSIRNNHVRQLLAHPLIPKKALQKINDERSFLLITTGNDFEDFEKRIIEKSRPLIQTDSLSVYDTPLDVFKHVSPNISSFEKWTPELKSGFKIHTQSSSNYSIDHINGHQTITKSESILTHTLDATHPTSEIEVSFWQNIEDMRHAPTIYIDVINQQGKISKRLYVSNDNYVDIYEVKVRFSALIYPTEMDSAIRVRALHANTYIESLWVQEKQQDILVVTEDEQYILNNYPLTR